MRSIPFKSGFAAVIGKPNAGKSTFVNAMSKSKVAITSSKPQTTRHRIMGIRTDEDSQIIFIDTPGIIRAENALDSFMEKIYKEETKEADVVLFLVDGSSHASEKDAEAAKLLSEIFKSNIPVFLLINKSDKAKKEYFEDYINLGPFNKTFVISSITGEGFDEVLKTLKNIFREGPAYFPKGTVTDQTPEFFAAEIVRENILKMLKEEVPHGVFVHTEETRAGKSEGTTYFQITIYVERETHKKIIIGKNGKLLRTIGIRSRKEIEKHLNGKVYLDLWIKVKEKWKNRADLLKSWGYV